MKPVIATGNELLHFMRDMREAHGVVNIFEDEGCPLLIEVDGQQLNSMIDIDAVLPNARVKIEGYISFGMQRGSYSLQRVFRDWQKGKNMVSQVVMVPCDKLEQLREMVKSIGGTLVI